MHRGWEHHGFVDFFCLTGSKNIVRVSFLCFRCFLVWKKVWIRNRGKGEKYHYFRSFRRKLLSHSANNFRGETFQVFRQVRVPKNFLHKKEISLSCVETFFHLTVPKQIRGKPFNASKYFGYRRLLCIRKGTSLFSIETILPHMNKKLRKWSLLFQKIFGSEKIMNHR